jgi:hypothetical protein
MQRANTTQGNTNESNNTDSTIVRSLLVLAAEVLVIIIALSACGGTIDDDPPPPPNNAGVGIPDPQLDPQPPQSAGAALPADNLVYACIRSTACGVKPYPRVSNCVAYYSDMLVTLGKAPLYDTIYGCANEAQSCSALKQCFGVTDVCNSSYQATCQGGKAVFCDLLDKTTFAYDCDAVGMKCAVDSQYSFAAKCVPAGATAPSSTTPVAAPAPGTMKSTVDCADGRCVKTGQTCSENDLNRCAGDGLEACLDGQWIRFDCGKLNLGACQTHVGGWASCGETL